MRPKILIVEDGREIRELIGQLLEAEIGGEVRYAEGNHDALAAIASDPPDLITTDIYHSGGRGDELFRKVREDPKTSHIPIVIISGNISEELELDLYRNGVEAVIRKPFMAKQLVARVTRLVRCDERMNR